MTEQNNKKTTNNDLTKHKDSALVTDAIVDAVANELNSRLMLRGLLGNEVADKYSDIDWNNEDEVLKIEKEREQFIAEHGDMYSHFKALVFKRMGSQMKNAVTKRLQDVNKGKYITVDDNWITVPRKECAEFFDIKDENVRKELSEPYQPKKNNKPYNDSLRNVGKEVVDSGVKKTNGGMMTFCKKPEKFKMTPSEITRDYNLVELFTIYGEKEKEVTNLIKTKRDEWWKSKGEILAQKRKLLTKKKKPLTKGSIRYKQELLTTVIFPKYGQWLTHKKMSYEVFLYITEDYDITPKDFSEAQIKYKYKGVITKPTTKE